MGILVGGLLFRYVSMENLPIYHNLSQMVAMPSGYYYFGGYDMNTKEITVLMVEPGKHPKITTLKDDPDSLQQGICMGALFCTAR